MPYQILFCLAVDTILIRIVIVLANVIVFQTYNCVINCNKFSSKYHALCLEVSSVYA